MQGDMAPVRNPQARPAGACLEERSERYSEATLGGGEAKFDEKGTIHQEHRLVEAHKGKSKKSREA